MEANYTKREEEELVKQAVGILMQVWVNRCIAGKQQEQIAFRQDTAVLLDVMGHPKKVGDAKCVIALTIEEFTPIENLEEQNSLED